MTRALALLASLALAGCTTPPTTDAGTPEADAPHAHDAGPPVDAPRADASLDAPSTEDTGPISAECADYCACWERDCASIQPIPTGQSCAEFCAGFTAEQWECRISHCRLVVPESNPGHCMHAVGIDQCL